LHRSMVKFTSKLMNHTQTTMWLCKENLMTRVRYLMMVLITTMLVIGGPTHANSQQQTKMKSVLVTGASTGIGRNLAETLASNGYHVYAGARKDKDLVALNAIDNITSVKLDVTKQDEIDAVVALIRKNDTGLYALVNNAGIGNGGAISQTPIVDHNMVYRVNVEGVYRVTKSFSPLIIESKGRISTTGSIAGTITRAGGSAYSGSKHWIEAFTDALALEMAPLDVMVSVIEPGNYQSHIRRSSVLRSFAKVKATGGEITPDMQKMFDDTSARELSYKKPDDVSAAFMHALFDEKPLRRYVVTPNQQEQAYTISSKVRQLVELNQWGPHSYTRDQLVEMLDKTIADKAK
jgi:NAD(P)-dependent dehydrogenase (short-subunit alcohol dehydrogenase family)